MVAYVLLGLVAACADRPGSTRSERSDSASQPPVSQPVTVRPGSSVSGCDSSILGKYGDLDVSNATGDVGGFEIVLQCSTGAYTATVTVAEGASVNPVLASADVHDTTVRFLFPPNTRLSGMEGFDGVVTHGHLVGHFRNNVDVDLTKRS